MEPSDQILSPPPTPHQLALMLITQATFPSHKQYPTLYPTRASCEPWYLEESQWLMKMLQMIIRECTGIYEPSTFGELMIELDVIRIKYARDPVGTVVCAPLKQLTRMPEIFADVQSGFEQVELILQLYVDEEEDAMGPTVIIQHTSPIAHFCRTIYIGYKILTFSQSYLLSDSILKYCYQEDPGKYRRQWEREKGAIARRARGVVGGAWQDSAEEEDEVAKKLDDFLKATNPIGEVPEGSANIAGAANRLTEIDDTIDIRLVAFQEYQKASHKGDYSKALASLSKFYNYRFPPAQGRQMHHHAMLNFAAFRFSTGGLEAAKAALEEAIAMARSMHDEQCLQQCFSLQKRLTSEMRPPMSSVLVQGLPPHADDIGEDGLYDSPLDELWGLKLRMDLGETLPNAYNRIHRVIGRIESIQQAIFVESVRIPLAKEHPEGMGASDQQRSDHERALKAESEREIAQAPLRAVPQSGMADTATIHGVQSGVWDMLGSQALSELHHDIASQCPKPSRDVDLTLAINKAERSTRKGKTMDALSRLLEPYVWENLNLSEYHKWAEAVWDVTETHVRRRDDHAALRLVRSSRLPTRSYRQLGPGGPSRVRDHIDEPFSQDFFDPEGNGIETRSSDRLSVQLAEAKILEVDGSAPMQVIQPLLSAVHTACKLGLWSTYRRSAADLADVFGGMEGRLDGKIEKAGDGSIDGTILRLGELEMEPLWEQILATEDAEIIFTAAWILTRAKRSKDPASAWIFGTACFNAALDLRSPSRMLKICAVLVVISNGLGSTESTAGILRYWNNVKDTQSVLPVPETVLHLMGARWNGEEDRAGVEMVKEIQEMIMLVGVNIANAV